MNRLIAGLAALLLAAPAAQAAAVEDHCHGPQAERMAAVYEEFARDVLNGAAPARITEYVGADFIWRDAPRGMPPGPEPMRRQFAAIATAFPDRKVATTFILCSDDLLMVHQTLTGTNAGPLLGYPASGKSHSVRHTEIYRFRDGRIVEQWGEGVIPLLLTRSGWTLVWPGDGAGAQAGR